MDIWKQCQGERQIKPLQYSHVWRIVEGQNSGSGTRKLVKTLEDHQILEEELEGSKPVLPENNEFQRLHYLLSTAFRYPPLNWGSRFGTRLERSVWYGSINLKAAFAEKAFYQLLFFKGSTAKLNPVEPRKTAYAVAIHAKQGIMLNKEPFNAYNYLISKKDSYEHSQLLGARMREAAIQAFSYDSARYEGSLNVGVISPQAFAKKSPISEQSWDCYNDGIHVEFTKVTGLKRERYAFSQEDYWVEGVFPFDHENS